jgi:hypothetical protein
MTCTEFLAAHSDFRDGLIGDPDLARRLSDHLIACPQCMRYDARLARGVTLLRTLSDLEPSPRFRRELARQLASRHLKLEEPVRPAPAGIMVGLMVATAAALVLWAGKTPSEGSDLPAGVTAVHHAVPLPAVVARASPPFVSFTELSAPAFEADLQTPGSGGESPVSWTGTEP